MTTTETESQEKSIQAIRIKEQMDYLEDKIKWCVTMRAFLTNYSQQLEELPPISSNYTSIDFDNLLHDQILLVIKAFGGKWEKTASVIENRIDYQCNHESGVIIRCWAGEPPPSCKIVEHYEDVPEQIIPAQRKLVRKLVCKE